MSLFRSCYFKSYAEAMKPHERRGDPIKREKNVPGHHETPPGDSMVRISAAATEQYVNGVGRWRRGGKLSVYNW